MAACATAAVLTPASSSSCDERNVGDGAMAAAETTSWPAASQECAVCLSKLGATGGVGSSDDAEPQAMLTLPVCGHGFHAECIGRWLPLRPECPLCRRPVLLQDDDIARGQPDARAVAASQATVAPAWARPPRIACGFGDGRVVWTRSPSVGQ